MNKYIVPFIAEKETRLPFYVITAGGSENQKPENRPQGLHDGNYQWMHCVKGKGKLVVGGQEYILSPGTGCLLYPYTPHKYYGIEKPWETHWITFNGFAVAGLFKVIQAYEIFSISNTASVEKYFMDLLTSAKSDSPYKTFETSSCLYNFLIQTSRYLNPVTTITKLTKNQQLQPVITYIEQNYSKDISLEEMASLINVTPNYFCRLFKKVFSMRPFEYITMHRLNKAKEMLTGVNSIYIKEIAEGVGFNDLSYFCALFKEHEGMTPIEYRKFHRNS